MDEFYAIAFSICVCPNFFVLLVSVYIFISSFFKYLHKCCFLIYYNFLFFLGWFLNIGLVG